MKSHALGILVDAFACLWHLARGSPMRTTLDTPADTSFLYAYYLALAADESLHETIMFTLSLKLPDVTSWLS